MPFKYLLVLFLVAVSQNLVAQEVDQHEKHHDHHLHEIGVANLLVYFVNEEETTYGLHLHYVYSFPHTRFGIGLGYERIFDEHKHNTVGIVGTYRPAEPVVLSVSPGITFEGGEESLTNFALHIEALYEFDFKDFHIGPVVEFAYDPEDYHISLGIHIGYGF